jgi:hypothetical protein
MRGIEEPFVDPALVLEDISTLFKTPDAGPVLVLKKGYVAAWDNTTRRNTITVEGSDLTDLPTLDFGTAITLAVGDVVGILAFGQSWFILGRILTP